MRRIPVLLAAALAVILPVGLITAPGPANAVTNSDVLSWVSGEPTYTAPSDRPDYVGVVYQGTWNILSDSGRAKVLDRLAQAGVTWIKMDLGWKSLQPSNASSYSSGDLAAWDKQIREVRARGFKILAQFNWAPAWASGTSNRNGRPKDPNQYATAAAYVAKRYNGSLSSSLKIDAMELWNEPNLSDSWNPSPSSTRVSSFAELIKKAGPAIKKANPNMTVVTGGLTAVDTDWISEFYKTSGVIGTYDALGVHPYQSPGDASPETYDASWGKYYMKHLAQLDKLMSSKGDGAKIWATEFGWSSHSNSSSTPGWARGVSEAKQAEYLVRSMPVMGAVSRVKAAFWYASVTTSNGDVQYDNYGILRKDLSRKPVWYGLRCAAAGVCGPNSSSSTPSSTTGKTLITAGSRWWYNDKGVDLGKAWRSDSYDQSAWPMAPAQLGYGDGDEKTVVSYGSSASNKRPTTYFRLYFDAGSSLSGINGLRLSALIDDGAKVYLNGTEIWRYNLTSGTVGYSTLAKTAIGGSAEKTWLSADVSSSLLKPSWNLLAVEVHQASLSSSDLSFDLKLTTR
jgi:polysaccharide biosynthesis protein PslG